MRLFLSFYVFLLLLSCQNQTNKSLQKDEIISLIGKEIEFPAYIKTEISKVKQKIIVYTKGEDCTECALSLPQWKYKINEIEKINQETKVFFIIDNADTLSIRTLFEKENIDAYVFFDKKSELCKLNKLPKNKKLHTFFLDKDNKVVLVGSPIDNDKMWTLYKKAFWDKNI